MYSWFYSDNLERCPLPTVGPILERPMLSHYRLMECFIPQCALTQNRNRPIDHPWFLRSDSVHLQIPNTKFYWKTCQLKRRSVKPQLIKTMSLYFLIRQTNFNKETHWNTKVITSRSEMVSQQNQNVFYETNLLHETFPTGQANKKYFQIITVIIPQIYTRNRDTSLLFKPLSCFFFF